jgi:hypothetical protein
MVLRKNKTVRGTKTKKRPSASYYYNVLGKKVGYKTSYRPKKGGKIVNFTLQLRKNGTPYWKPVSKQTKKTKKNKKTVKRRDLIKGSRGSITKMRGGCGKRKIQKGG